MNIIGVLVVIGIIIAIFEVIAEKIKEGATIIVGGIVSIVAIVVVVYVLKKVLGIAYSFICMIPSWLLYGYCLLFILAAFIWLMICYCNVRLKYAIEDALVFRRYYGDDVSIQSRVKCDLLEYTESGLIKKLVASKRYERMFYSILRQNSFSFSDSANFCTQVLVDDVKDVIDTMAMATDKELIVKIHSDCQENNELMKLSRTVKEFQEILGALVKIKYMDKVSLKTDENLEPEEQYEHYEPILYVSKHQKPEPENIIPGSVLEID